jgi:hypothetical protein
VNHAFNARLHKYPACPECDAAECMPCVTASGTVREPHRVRARMTSGELLVLELSPKLAPIAAAEMAFRYRIAHRPKPPSADEARQLVELQAKVKGIRPEQVRSGAQAIAQHLGKKRR